MSVDSRDYIVLTGSKELLNEVEYDKELPYPWDTQDIEHNRRIVKEYLEFRHNSIQNKIQNG